ncbi:hypothetical protein ABZY31_13155 [Streptomyces sp. NPDC006529]
MSSDSPDLGFTVRGHVIAGGDTTSFAASWDTVSSEFGGVSIVTG